MSNRGKIVLIDIVSHSENDKHMFYCRKIIKHFAPNAKLYCICIKDTGDNKPLLPQLIKALYRAKKYRPLIVSLSVGSTEISDARQLSRVISEMYKDGILILAAISNKRMPTFPASLKKVYGVMTNAFFPYKQPVIYHLGENDLGVDFFVSDKEKDYQDKIKFGNNENNKCYLCGNSFATPYVAAVLFNMFVETHCTYVFEMREMLQKRKIFCQANITDF